MNRGMTTESIVLRHGALQRTLSMDRDRRWRTEEYRGGAGTFARGGAEFTIHCADGTAYQATDFTVSAITQDAESVEVTLIRESCAVVLTYRHGPLEGTLQKRLSLTNHGAAPLPVPAVDVEDLLLVGDVVPDAQRDPQPAQRDAQPVLGDGFFAGLDWPLAQNWVAQGRLRTRQFCPGPLAPGHQWISCWATCGTATECAAGAFAAYLQALACYQGPGRSLYFDWLTHRSEGPTQQETELLLTLLADLRRAFGVRFDLFALDDGAVETRGERYFRTYQREYQARFPRGLQAVSALAAAEGLRLGLWLGPNDFGAPGQEHRRIEEVAAMVRDWRLAVLKLDTVVGPLLGPDRAENERRMQALATMAETLRAIEPELLILNHRISTSPYVLSILDTVLWDGAESYVDVFAWNERPRLWSRHAALGRGVPSYVGHYSRALEDHGVCANGFPDGFLSEMIVHTFGRALLVSPEVYGMLFTLSDDDLGALGKVCRLADDRRALLARTPLVGDGSIARGDGDHAIVMLVNDDWLPRTQTFTINAALGLDPGRVPPGGYLARRRFPHDRVLAGDDGGAILRWDARLSVALAPFEATVIDVQPQIGQDYPLDAWYEEIGPGSVYAHYRLPAGPLHRALGPVPPVALDGAQARDLQRRVEGLKFALCDDPLEIQALATAAPSRLESIQACRASWTARVRRDSQGIAANAWSGDGALAWGDRGVAPYTVDAWVAPQNLWRIDLGALWAITEVEMDCTTGIVLPCSFSADLVTWEDGALHPVDGDGDQPPVGDHEDQPATAWHRLRMTRPTPRPVRYLRLHGRGFLLRHITMRTRDGAVPTDGWRGTNCYGPTPLLTTCWETRLSLPRTWPGLRLAIVAQSDALLPDTIDGLFALAHDGHGDVLVARRSPSYPFHAWESDQRLAVSGLTWVLDVTPALAGRALTVTVCAFGSVPDLTVHAYLVTDPLPWQEMSR